MRGSKAKPLSNRAAEFTLELNKVTSMFWAISLASANYLSTAFATNQILRTKITLVLCLVAIL